MLFVIQRTDGIGKLAMNIWDAADIADELGDAKVFQVTVGNRQEVNFETFETMEA